MLATIYNKSGVPIHKEEVKYKTSGNFFEYKIRLGKRDSKYVQAYEAGLPIIITGNDVLGGKYLFQKYPTLQLNKWGDLTWGTPEWVDGLQQAVNSLGEFGAVSINFNYESKTRSAEVAQIFTDELTRRTFQWIAEITAGGGFRIYNPSHPYVQPQ